MEDHGTETRNVDETIVSTVELHEMNSSIEEIGPALVESSDVEYDSVRPLARHVDTDAVEAIFLPSATAPQSRGAQLPLGTDGCQVDIDENGAFGIKRIHQQVP